MKNQLPRRESISIVFLPNHPSPASWAKSRSMIGAESTHARVSILGYCCSIQRLRERSFPRRTL